MQDNSLHHLRWSPSLGEGGSARRGVSAGEAPSLRELSPEATEGVKICKITPSTTLGGPPPSGREATPAAG